ncbi:sensor histidine kinase [Luteococcus peritonei]|uniref:Sensor histidine kinase n=1 Tax=Luteococcus peritonei TaxID=88874 RepID=A0ABW4RU18_9ACTN
MSQSTAVETSPAVGRIRRAFRVGWPLLWGINIAPLAWRDAQHGGTDHWLAGGLVLAGTVLTVVLTMWVTSQLHAGRTTTHPAALLALAACLVAGFVSWQVTREAAHLQLVPFVAVALALMYDWHVALPVNLVLAAAVFLADPLDAGWSEAHGMALGTLGAMAGAGFGRIASQRGREARAMTEHARQLEISEERNRMARDLHDILGHSLTVITLKADLAARLVDADPQAAKQELAEVQSLSRSALADVRATVNNYREMSLAGEIARAAKTLGSAGVKAELPTSVDQVELDLRELFAWSLREAVTNVVRHAEARHCRVELGAGWISVADDGRGISGPTDGHGLEGLRQRAAAAGCRVDLAAGIGGRGAELRVARVDA